MNRGSAAKSHLDYGASLRLVRILAPGGIKLRKYALVYDPKLLENAGQLVGIRDALGTAFDYNKLMEPVNKQADQAA